MRLFLSLLRTSCSRRPKTLTSRLFPVLCFAAVFGLLPMSAASGGEVTPPDQIAVPPGFKVELLRTAGPREGSWVSMTVDD
jgi:hypothetical protein